MLGFGWRVAAAQATWVEPVELHGPYFEDEARAVQAAVAERLAREPGVQLVDASRWVALASEHRTEADGPVCAAAPRLEALVELRTGATSASPALVHGKLIFGAGDLGYEVELPGFDVPAWRRAIARVVGHRGGGGGGIGYPEVRGAFVVRFDDWAWTGPPAEETLRSLADSLAPCRDTDPARDRDREIETRWVLAVGADGGVRRVEESTGTRSAARACIEARLRELRFPAGADGRRLALFVEDPPLEPIERLPGLLNFRLAEAPALVETRPLYDDPRFHRCEIPSGATLFTLQLDATGRVAEARVTGVPDALRTCLEDALRGVAFPCPEGGPATVRGTIDRRP